MRLDPGHLLRAAVEQTGISDYGDPGFREPFEILLRSIEADAALNDIGRLAAPALIQQLLVNRLQLVDTWKRHPEIGEGQVRRPIFILGLSRTGTTALHALLAVDPAHRTPLSWEVSFPCPPPERATFETDARIAQTDAQLAMLHQVIPEFQSIHPQGAREPQECVAITAHDFMGVQFTSTFRATTYWDWLEAQPQSRWRLAYEFHRRFLQHLQWKCPGERWVLKSPGHLYSLDALLDSYPDAVVIWTHRHPAEVIASTASLHAVLRSAYSDDVDPKAIGREILDRFSRAIDRAVSVRDRRPHDAHRFVDVRYGEFLAAPLDTIHAIYQHFGLPFTAEARAAMQAHIAAHPKGKHGAHRYTPEMFGLSAEGISEQCRRYCERFGFNR